MWLILPPILAALLFCFIRIVQARDRLTAFLHHLESAPRASEPASLQDLISLSQAVQTRDPEGVVIPDDASNPAVLATDEHG